MIIINDLQIHIHFINILIVFKIKRKKLIRHKVKQDYQEYNFHEVFIVKPISLSLHSLYPIVKYYLRMDENPCL